MPFGALKRKTLVLIMRVKVTARGCSDNFSKIFDYRLSILTLTDSFKKREFFSYNFEMTFRPAPQSGTLSVIRWAYAQSAYSLVMLMSNTDLKYFLNYVYRLRSFLSDVSEMFRFWNLEDYLSWLFLQIHNFQIILKILV